MPQASPEMNEAYLPSGGSDDAFPYLSALEVSFSETELSGITLGKRLHNAGAELLTNPQAAGEAEALSRFIVSIQMILTSKEVSYIKDSQNLRRACYVQLLALMSYPYQIDGYDVQQDILSLVPSVDTRWIYDDANPPQDPQERIFYQEQATQIESLSGMFFIAQMAQDDEVKRNTMAAMLYKIDETTDEITKDQLRKTFFARPSSAIYAVNVIYQDIASANGRIGIEEAREAYARAHDIMSIPFPKTNALTLSGYDVIQDQIRQMKRNPSVLKPARDDSFIILLRTAEHSLLSSEK